jgi:hypothetical protein
MADAGDVGLVIDEFSFPVEEGKVREFVLAAGGTLPEDGSAPPVPLTFAAVAGHWRDQAAMVAALRLDIRRVVVGGSEWEHRVPVAIGDRLGGERIVTAVEAKERPNGTMTVMTIETALRRQDGEVAVVQRDTVIELPGGSS